jgi:DNA helicase-2/ATP-dependent DNA helicase PcrA
VDEEALKRADRGSIVAPAGCGKTELIARTALRLGREHALLLTHTHAGVNALRGRLHRLAVPRERVHVETIAGWSLRYATAYPARSGLRTAQPTKGEWENVYDSALALLDVPAIRRVVVASYSRIFVDEYQDCTERQHRLIVKLADLRPTIVLGDPLQGIFGFAGGSLPWSGTVEAAFPSLGSLDEPWRWKGKNDALGRWLLSVRDPLCAGTPIDLAAGPFRWLSRTPDNQRAAAFDLLRSRGSVVAIRKWAKDAHAFARNVGGPYSSMEEMECNDLLALAADLDDCDGTARAARALRFATECWTEVSSALQTLQGTLDQGRIPARSRSSKLAPIVTAFATAATTSAWSDLRAALLSIEALPKARLFRREMWREAMRAITQMAHGQETSLRDLAWRIRQRVRLMGRALDPRSVSRTLLIKGLEFDHALVLDANEFEDGHRPGDGARHFYVAVTRGCQSLVILSQEASIAFSRPTL